MASFIIHIAVANEINKVTKRDSRKLLIGTIAPDISKLVGETKVYSHFLDKDEDSIPNLNMFLKKYKCKLNDDFVLGYYIHLYTDYLWYKYFMSEIIKKDVVTKLDGTVVKCDDVSKYVYNDYTNLNVRLIDEYDLDYKIFYEEIPEMEDIIDEIPMKDLYMIVNQAGLIISNSKRSKEYIFNVEQVKRFIDVSVKYILSNLNELGIIENQD